MKTLVVAVLVAVLGLALGSCGVCVRGAWVKGEWVYVDCRVADELPYPSGPVIEPPTRCEVEKSAGRPCSDAVKP